MALATHTGILSCAQSTTLHSMASAYAQCSSTTAVVRSIFLLMFFRLLYSQTRHAVSLQLLRCSQMLNHPVPAGHPSQEGNCLASRIFPSWEGWRGAPGWLRGAPHCGHGTPCPHNCCAAYSDRICNPPLRYALTHSHPAGKYNHPQDINARIRIYIKKTELTTAILRFGVTFEPRYIFGA